MGDYIYHLPPSWGGGFDERSSGYIDLPSRERIHSPPNGKFGKSSTQNAMFGGICDRSLEGMLMFFW